MKAFILVSFLSVAANAQVYFKSVSICSSWSYKDGGYVCSFPSTEYVPDQFSLNSKVTNLENRIAALEKKIADMEAAQQQQKAH